MNDPRRALVVSRLSGKNAKFELCQCASVTLRVIFRRWQAQNLSDDGPIGVAELLMRLHQLGCKCCGGVSLDCEQNMFLACIGILIREIYLDWILATIVMCRSFSLVSRAVRVVRRVLTSSSEVCSHGSGHGRRHLLYFDIENIKPILHCAQKNQRVAHQNAFRTTCADCACSTIIQNRIRDQTLWRIWEIKSISELNHFLGAAVFDDDGATNISCCQASCAFNLHPAGNHSPWLEVASIVDNMSIGSILANPGFILDVLLKFLLLLF